MFQINSASFLFFLASRVYPSNGLRSIIQETSKVDNTGMKKDMMKSYWQAGITLPLFQMAQSFWPFHACGCVKPWPLCSASRSHCVWVRVFRRGSNCVINSQRYEKPNLNLHRLCLYHWKFLCHHIWRKASATCLNLTQNKPTFTNNTHKKSVNIYLGLLSHLFFPLSNFFFLLRFLGETWEKKEGEWWDISASLWRVKVSLFAWWLVHSADVTWSLSRGSHLPGCSCRGPASLQSSGSCVTGRNHTASSSIQTCCSTCLQCPEGQSG